MQTKGQIVIFVDDRTLWLDSVRTHKQHAVRKLQQFVERVDRALGI